MVMNVNEDQLISCSFDKQIIVWKINSIKNTIQFDYALEQKHTLWVYSISINPLENTFISCGGDKMIVLWIKASKWVYKTHIVMDDFGFRLSFINDNQFVWLKQGVGILHVFENKQGQLVQRPELTLELNNGQVGHGLFPIIFDKNKELLILKHNRFVYLIKIQKEIQKLYILGQPIECGDQQSFGALNGEDLIIGNNQTQELKWYQLRFQ